MKTRYHEQDGNFILQTYQDVEPHLEYAAKYRREEWDNMDDLVSVGNSAER